MIVSSLCLAANVNNIWVFENVECVLISVLTNALFFNRLVINYVALI